MIIRFLNENHCRLTRQSAAKDGVSAQTFIGQLDILENGKFENCYIKIYPEEYYGLEHKGIINEMIGHIVARTLNLPVPDNAGLIILNQEQIPFKNGNDINSSIIAWWVQDMIFPSVNRYLQIDHLTSDNVSQKISNFFNEFRECSEASNIIIFDEIIANIDRNLGNLLRMQKGKYLLIDHGSCLTGNTWTQDCLNPQNIYDNKILKYLNNNSLVSDHLKSCMILYQESIIEKLNSIEQNINNFMNNILEKSDIDAVNNFISSKVILNMKDRLGLLT